MPQPCPPETTSLLTDPLMLPNGVVLANRLAKAATNEHLATRLGAPTPHRLAACPREESRNVGIEDDRDLAALQDWAQVTHGSDAKLILQLSHPGRQTMRGMSVGGEREERR